MCISKTFFRISLTIAFAVLSVVCQAQGGKTVLEELANVRESYGVRFVYDSELDRLLDIEYSGVPVKGLDLDNALDSLLKGTGVVWSRRKGYIILTSASGSSEVPGKRITVSGYILDSKSGEPLIGAGVRSEVDGRGAVSNNYGFYSLRIPQGSVRLECSYVGYETQKLSFKAVKDTVLNIRLRPGNILSEASITARKEYDFISRGLSAIDIPIEQIRQTPTVLGEADILKTLQLLPGVQAGTNGFAGLYVRGGGPDENLLMLDGTALYNAEHMLGVFSIFMPDAVKKVTLYKGAFPARFGGRVSSVVDVRTDDGNLEEHKGSVSVSVLSSKVHLEGPIVKGKGSYSFSGRLMHSLFAQPFIKSYEADDKYNYWFYDLNGKVTYRLGDYDRLYLNVYNGLDKMYYDGQTKGKDPLTDEEPEYADGYRGVDYVDKTKTRIQWGNTLVSGRWNHVFNNRLFANTTVAYNHYRMVTGIREGSEANYLRAGGFAAKDSLDVSSVRMNYNSGIWDLSANVDFDFIPSSSHLIRFGGEYVFHTFRPENLAMNRRVTGNGNVLQDTCYRQTSSDIIRGHDFSLYAEDEYSVTERLSFNPGLRLNVFSVNGKTYLSIQPRVSARYGFRNGLALKAGYSRMSQNVHLLTSSQISLPMDLWVPVTDKVKPVVSDQYCVGLSYDGLKGWEMSLEGYYKSLKNVLGYTDGSSLLGNTGNWQDRVVMGDGRSMGMELFIRKMSGKTTGWISYTLAKTDRRFPDGSVGGADWYPYKYDRRHSAALVLNQKIGKKIDINGTWTFSSGGVLSIPERQTVVLDPDSGKLHRADLFARRGNYRLPSSHCLSIGMNYRKKKRRGESVWNITVYNVYNQKNPDLVFNDVKYADTYYQSQGCVRIKSITMMPIIPSLGYTYNF